MPPPRAAPPNGFLPQDLSHSRQTSNLSRLDETRSSHVSVPATAAAREKTLSTTMTTVVADDNARNASLLRRDRKVAPHARAESARAPRHDLRFVNLAVLFLGATVMTILALQLLYHIEGAMHAPRTASQLPQRHHDALRKVAAVFACVAVVLDLCAVLVSAMQLLCAVRLLLTRPCPELRVTSYLSQCFVVRVSVVIGFFISLLLLLVVLALYYYMRFDLEAAYISTAFIAAATIFFIIAASHNAWAWHKQASMPYQEPRGAHDNAGFVRDFDVTCCSSEPPLIGVKLEDIHELSTLV
ncbi:PREDICTED: uncharacterized protein LOC106814626 [Priapulus caudatus]|uniref:Uncharacterized protein LOC106814626 n=1 Tax=Priapulus caudatus TaxID=37621 RepID=A0ABM1EQH8_PRICU|nr:PREDICTED: uncharacterized protein LOC106814626 [Priapulus caudatus]